MRQARCIDKLPGTLWHGSNVGIRSVPGERCDAGRSEHAQSARMELIVWSSRTMLACPIKSYLIRNARPLQAQLFDHHLAGDGGGRYTP